MPASVARSASRAHSLRTPSITRPVFKTLGSTLNRRNQVRYIRLRWTPPWGSDQPSEHWRQHRELWQEYAKLRDEVWSAEWSGRNSFPPLTREIERLEKWASDVGADFPPRHKRERKRYHGLVSWSGSCDGHVPSRRWGYYCTWSHHGGRNAGSDATKSDGESKPSETHPSEPAKPPIEETSNAVQQGKPWIADSPGPSDYFIDPITNKKVPRSKTSTEAGDGVSNEKLDEVESSPLTTSSNLGAGDNVACKGPAAIEPSLPTAASNPGASEPEGGKHMDGVASVKPQPLERYYPCVPDEQVKETSDQGNGASFSTEMATNARKDVGAIDPVLEPPLNRCDPPPGTEETAADTQDGKNSAEMTGNYVKDFPEDFAESWVGRYHSEEPASGLGEPTERLEPAISRTRTQAPKEEALAEANEGKKETEMTGNYVKDFPEDFVESWVGRYHSEEPASGQEEPTERLEPAINRTRAHTPEDSAPTTAPPKSTEDDLTEEIRRIYEESYGAIDDVPVQTSPPDTVEPYPTASIKPPGAMPEDAEHPIEQPPTMYKILVYDPLARTMVATDASSTVPDGMEALTPAEAVTRLSNPARFLPHFGPLQAQGYEVLSGEGDVLVFRRIRKATEPGMVFLRGATGPTSTALNSAGPTSTARPVNPIDMMGSQPVIPNIGNFASPTGYVNYDEVMEGQAAARKKPPPPFRAESEVEYEREADPETTPSGKRKKGSGVLWRTSVGAAWMAGLAYGGSVVNQYFKTGGKDGEGPKGHF